MRLVNEVGENERLIGCLGGFEEDPMCYLLVLFDTPMVLEIGLLFLAF